MPKLSPIPSALLLSLLALGAAACAPAIDDKADEGAADGAADTAADEGAADGGADGATDGATDGGGDGATDGGGDGATDGGGDGTTDGGGDGTTDGGDGAEPPPLLPVAGAWSLARTELISDSCGVARFQDPTAFLADDYTVSHIDPVTFALAELDGEPGPCTVTDGETFTCAPAQLRQDLGSFGFDAEMVIDQTLSGALSPDGRAIDGQADISVTCEGTCWALEFVLAFPCPMQLDMDLTAD